MVIYMKILSKRAVYIGCFVSLSLALSTQVYGGALYIYETGNSADVGTAGAGLAAKAQDATTAFNNPAGMTRIKKPELFAGATFMYLNAPFKPNDETTVPGPNGGTSEIFAAGNFAYVHPVGSKLALGISAQNFFGLSLNWGEKWVGRYQVTEEWLIAPQVQPTAAYKVNDWLSIGAGAGLTVGYLKTEANVYNADFPKDGNLKYEDYDFAVQGNFGVMVEPNQNTRIGIRYLTETKLKFSDQLSIAGVPPRSALKAKVSPVDLDITMPQSLNLSFFHQINETWAILGSLGWEDWSQFGKVGAGLDKFGNGITLDINTNDVYHFGIGGQYRWDPQLLIDFGFSFDSGLFDDEDRSILIPMGDLYRVGTGFKYEMHENFTIGAAVEFMWEGDLPVKTASSSAGDVGGEYSNVWFIFPAVYGVWRF
jgi:long-chain fatty acid transport protein